MKDLSKTLFIIQARLSSKRVPGKMLRKFSNTTLIDIAIEKVLSSKVIPKENFYLSVYEQELIEVAEKYGVNVYQRSLKSKNAENNLCDLYEWHDKLPFDYAVKINGCNPFLSIETIDAFVEKYMETESRGLFAVVEKKNYFWNEKKEMLNTPRPTKGEVMNTKIVSPIYEAAQCLFAGDMRQIKEGIWMGEFDTDDPELYVIQEHEALDIDYEWQFQMCEALYDLNFSIA